MAKKKNYFSDPEKFLEDMRSWQARGKVFEDQNELCLHYYDLADKTVAAYGKGHIEHMDLVQWCVLSCCQKARFFDESRGTCFNFFTRVIINKIKVVYKIENNKFNPKVHQSIEDEYDEALASLVVDEEPTNKFPKKNAMLFKDYKKIGKTSNANI